MERGVAEKALETGRMEYGFFCRSEEGVGCRAQLERLSRPSVLWADAEEGEYVGVCYQGPQEFMG